MSILLGPFALEKPIGRGGMGEVWKGRHLAENEAVAVKIMHRDTLRRPDYLEAFRDEVRHVAALDHPGIVVVFDYGEISEEAEQDSGGQLVKGSPYIVMEYASKGSLQEIQAYLGWAELRQVLLVVLDALAHAHARNVIHRDLKPENILVGCSGTQAIKLTDFGLAHATDRFRDSSRVEDVWGTPQYMAPEQLRGLWRDYGPWTDLYGLGCMAYQLVCGKYLYDGASVWEIGKAHMMSPIPALEPKIAVPDGFEEWLVRLLQKERFHRFQTAADAAWVLRQLDGGLSGGKARPLADLMSSNEEKGDEPITVLLSRIAGAPTIQTRTRTVDLDDWFAANPMDEISSDYEGAAGDLPGMPPIREDWRPTRDGHRSPHLLGVGLGLYGLRSIPLVDRDKERDLIWSSLRSVHEETSARAIVFRGVGGTGKSELVQWMSRRAVELGSATVLKATHDPGPSSAPGPSDGLEAMMGRHLRCLKLERDEIEARLRDKFKKWGVRDDYAVLAMTEFLSPLRQDLLDDDVNEAARSVRFFSSRQRYALLYEHLERLAVERPVIVWLDDVQTGADALGFVHYVLEAQSVRPASVLLLMTVNDETLDSRDVERLLLNEVLEQPGVMVCPIGPLEDEDTSTLVQHLLGLDDALARQVKKRSQGIPLFAVQLVGDWVGQGKLTLGPEGFSIRPGEVIEIPDDLHALWGERLDKVLAGHDEGARVSLEIAAALGQTVDSREWRSACRFGKAQATTRLVEELIKEGLAESAESGWSFSHGMLRESIERTAREQGRWARGSAACAHMLFHLYSPKDFGVSERFGRHMIEAGWPGEALAPFLTAVDLLIERSEFRRAHVLLDEREDILSRLNAPDNEPERCQGWTRRAAILEYEGRYTEALTRASEAAHQASHQSWDELLAPALLQQGLAERHLGRLDQAEENLKAACSLFEGLFEVRGHGRSLLGLGRVAEQRGDFDQAAIYFDGGRDLFERSGDMLGVAQSLNALGDIARQSQDYSLARSYSNQALQTSKNIGYQIGVADGLNDIAEWDRLQGDLDSARARCIEARDLYRALGSQKSQFVELNLGLIHLEQGDFAEASKIFERLEMDFRSTQQWSLLAHAMVGLLPGYADNGNWEAFDWCFHEAVRLLEQTGINDPNITIAARIGAIVADEAGELSRAEALRKIIRSQREAITSSQVLRRIVVEDE